MERPITVTIHPSCLPHRTRAAYLESFRARRMNHRFHYESEKQAQQWLAIHEAYSPARTDDDCLKTYERAFTETARLIGTDEVTVVSIGCGGGQKDIALMQKFSRRSVRYIPSDVSLPLTLTAHQRAAAELKVDSRPALVDLPRAADFPAFIDRLVAPGSRRLFAYFGMLPNFEPAESLDLLFAALRPNDWLIASANLSPGPDYPAGVEKILPLYDNELTKRWLSTVLLDAGLDISPSDIHFAIRQVSALLRVEANYTFRSAQTIRIDEHEFKYAPGDEFRLFFSYRHTPTLLRQLFEPHGVEIARDWITPSGEEGVFLCRKRL